MSPSVDVLSELSHVAMYPGLNIQHISVRQHGRAACSGSRRDRETGAARMNETVSRCRKNLRLRQCLVAKFQNDCTAPETPFDYAFPILSLIDNVPRTSPTRGRTEAQNALQTWPPLSARSPRHAMLCPALHDSRVPRPLAPPDRSQRVDHARRHARGPRVDVHVQGHVDCVPRLRHDHAGMFAHAVERVERRDEVRLVARRACSAFERVARVQHVLVAAQMGMKGADDGLGHAQTAEKSLATSLSCLKNSPRHCVARGEGM